MSVDFVAAVSGNHHQDLGRCLDFVDQAAQVGCSAIKFQLFEAEDIASPILTDNDPSGLAKNRVLPRSFLGKLKTRCLDVGIRFACAPFYLGAVNELLSHIDYFKISSAAMCWTELLVACAKTERPITLSTGMATLEEIQDAVFTLRDHGSDDITLLHCVSAYPVPVRAANLSAIETLRREFGYPTGWSDHSADPAVIYRAVHRFNAQTIEFHLDLDGTTEEYSRGHCWLPEQIQPIIATIKQGLSADGHGEKTCASCEADAHKRRIAPNQND